MEDVDKEISEMKLSLNARARIVAESYLTAVGFPGSQLSIRELIIRNSTVWLMTFSANFLLSPSPPTLRVDQLLLLGKIPEHISVMRLILRFLNANMYTKITTRLLYT